VQRPVRMRTGQASQWRAASPAAGSWPKIDSANLDVNITSITAKSRRGAAAMYKSARPQSLAAQEWLQHRAACSLRRNGEPAPREHGWRQLLLMSPAAVLLLEGSEGGPPLQGHGRASRLQGFLTVGYSLEPFAIALSEDCGRRVSLPLVLAV